MWKDVFQEGISFRDRLGYLFGPPGWSHDGSRHTSEEMRQIEDGQNPGINTWEMERDVQYVHAKKDF